MMRLRCALAVLVGSCIFAPAAARADRGDWGVGALGTWEISDGGSGGVAAEFGLSDAAALRGEVTYGHAQGRTRTMMVAGPTLAWDVVAWVPALTVGLGMQVGHSVQAVGLVRGEVRHYVHRAVWLSLGAAAELRPDNITGQVLASAFWQL